MAPRVAAGFVTYNPDVDEFERAIRAVSDQVDSLLIVDNGSATISALEKLLDRVPRVTLIKNSENTGIANALNQLMAIAEGNGLEWVLTLDQDSIVSPGFVDALEVCADDESIGIVCPRVVDRNFSLQASDEAAVREVTECITSGSLTRISAWRRVGGFDVKLFIDFVDFDYCCSLRSLGYRIVRVADAILSHQLGKSTSVRIFGRDVVAYHHPPLRRFYFARNLVYYVRKHKGRVNAGHLYVALLKRTMITLALEDQKWRKLVAAINGVRAGLSM